MKKIVIFFLLFIFLGTVLGAGTSAASTIFGQTGLIEMPSAYVLTADEFSAGLTVRENEHIAFGSFGLSEQLELGVTYYSRVNRNSFEPHAKYQIYKEDGEVPALAFGIQKISPYIVFSRQFADPRLSGHAGFGGGHLNGFMVGFSYLLNKSGDNIPLKSITGEYVDYGFNLGMEFNIDSLIDITVASLNMEEMMVSLNLKRQF